MCAFDPQNCDWYLRSKCKELKLYLLCVHLAQAFVIEMHVTTAHANGPMNSGQIIPTFPLLVFKSTVSVPLIKSSLRPVLFSNL